MKRKGFTLIELLGVIIILGVLSMITFPIILNQIRNAKQGIKDSTKTLIIDAAKDYYEDNTNNYDLIEGMTYCINISTLTDNNYLNKKLKDDNLNDIDTTQKVKMIYHNDKFNYEVVDSCTYYTVTFDPNGGSVDTTSKEVIQNSAYGTLPTPTRTGYTFLGWNSKNLLSIDKLNAHNFAAGGFIGVDCKQNTSYTLSSSLPGIGGQNNSANVFLTLDVNNNSTGNNGVFPNIPRTITTGSNEIIYVGLRDFQKTYENEATNYWYQLEEGDTATEYEPYYITPETKVVQEQNHTLKAIWKAN